jgi:peptide/nickel transport system substrate-binding protein
MSDAQNKRLHPGVLQAQEQLKQGRISRREFLRVSTLLGANASLAMFLAACGAGTSSPAPTSAPSAGGDPTAAPAAAGIRRGGTFKVGLNVQAVDHPARFSWTEAANPFRLSFEYLAETGADNITRPLLLESWEANDDLTVWTLNLRQGLMWSNGDELVADHVVFNFGEWLNPDVGSSILGLWDGFLTMDGIEKVDDYTVRLNLSRPKLDVPENLYHYPAIIIHPDFDGDISSGANPYIGPFKLVEYVVGERARFERQENYWQMGEDGQPLPYLDAIEFISLGDDKTAQVSALLTGEIHNFYEPGPNEYQTVLNDDRVKVFSVDTAQARVLRMRVDQEPFTDVRVRNAIKMSQDRESVLEIAAFGEGALGHDVHVSPVQPEFAPMDVPTYDPEGAKALLAEAGYPDGIDVSVAVGTGWGDVVAYAESMQQTFQAAGINLTLETMPNTSYWDIWSETAFGITPWTHRPLAVMLLPLAYTADSSGEPVAWNETRWVDDEFVTLLEQAQGTLDVEARRVLMADIQRIMLERGPIGIAWWMRVWDMFNPAFQGVYCHPTLHNLYAKTMWYDPDQDPFA